MRRIVLIMALACLAAGVARAHPQDAASPLTVVAQVGPAIVADGGTALFAIHTQPGADCSARVLYDDGSPGPSLPTQHVGSSGIVQWQLTVHTAAGGGTAAAACTVDGHVQAGMARFTVPVNSQPANPPANPVPASPYPTHQVDMLQVTPYKVETVPNLGDQQQPRAGDEYLVVWLAALNGSGLPVSIGPAAFAVIGPDGRAGHAGPLSPWPVFGGRLAPGGITIGSMTFQVPSGSHSARLTWTAGAGMPTVAWTLRY